MMKVLIILLYFALILPNHCKANDEKRQTTEFDGVLTSNVLLDWGFNATTTIMRIDRRQISSILPETFNLFTNLISLDLSNNLLEEVKDNWFIGLSRLTTLDLTSNSILNLFKFNKSTKFVSLQKQD